MRDKYTLVTKLWNSVEKKFYQDSEVTKSFLELCCVIFRNQDLKGSELHTQLRNVMVMGLTCSDCEVREKYISLLNESVPGTVYDRLMYIMCRMRWDCTAQHYWIKQAIEILLLTADQSQNLEIVKNWQFTDISFQNYSASGINHATESSSVDVVKTEIMDYEDEKTKAENGFCAEFHSLWQKNLAMLTNSAKLKVADLLPHLLYLCNENADLAENIWFSSIPAFWDSFTELERSNISTEIVPFLSSKYHNKQIENYPSVLKTFVEAFSVCKMPAIIKPQLIRDVFDCLADLYLSINEVDLWTAIWTKRSKYPDTKAALAYMQHDMFVEASELLEKAMTTEENRLSSLYMNLNTFNELRLWEDQWIKCMQELNQWDLLQEYAASKEVADPFLLLESSWRIPNWTAMKESIFQIEHACPANYLWKLHLYRGYQTLCCGSDDQTTASPQAINASPGGGAASATSVDRAADAAHRWLIVEWRKMPRLVGPAHQPLLHAAQRVVELQEASQLRNTLLPAHINRNTNVTEMKSIMKTWRNRLPTIADPLSYWNQIFTWRLYNYQYLISTLEADPQTSQNTVLGIHAYAQALLQLARAIRKQNIPTVAVDVLNRLHTIPNLPVFDGYQKLREQVKCCVKMAKMTSDDKFYNEALDLIENTNISYFAKENSGEFYALKGLILSQVQNRTEDANNAFSAGLQLFDASSRSWAYWGNHLELCFSKDCQRPINVASQALVSFLQATRLCSYELKARKYIPRILWLLKFDSTDSCVLHENLARFTHLISPMHWITWIPELLSHLKQSCNQSVVDLLIRLGKAFPETLFYALKFFEHGLLEDLLQNTISDSAQSTPVYPRSSIVRRRARNSETAALEPWQKCFRDVVVSLRESYPYLISTLVRTCNELSRLPSKHWSALCIAQMRLILDESFRLAFENRNDNQLATVPAHIRQKLKSVHSLLLEYKSNAEVANLANNFEKEFDLDNFATPRLLQPFAAKLIKWLKNFDTHFSAQPSRQLLPNISEHLSSFLTKYVACDMPTEIFTAKPLHFRVRIAEFLPKVEVMRRGSWICKRISLRAINGKKYAFLVISLNESIKSQRFARLTQVLRHCNAILSRNKGCCSRLLKFNVPSFVPVGQNTVLLYDDGSCGTFLDIFKEILSVRDMCPDDVIMRYFDKLTVQQSRSGRLNDQQLREIFKGMLNSVVQKNSLTEYFSGVYQNAESYFTMRKQICLHLALINLVVCAFDLNTLGPETMTLDKASGFVSPTLLHFDLEKAMRSLNGEMSNPSAMLRLSSCLVDFLGCTVAGQLTPAILAASRALNRPPLRHMLRLILSNEFFDHASATIAKDATSKSVDAAQCLPKAENFADLIMKRFDDMGRFEESAFNVNSLVTASQNVENLCQIDPVWHPWF